MDRRHGDGGETLIELLISVAILGIAAVAIVNGLGALVVGTDVHRLQSTGGTLLLSAADAVKSTTTTYTPCATTASYAGAITSAVTLPSGWTAPTVQSVAYWNGTAFGPTCFESAAVPTVAAIQLVTIRATVPNSRGDLTISVTKRRA